MIVGVDCSSFGIRKSATSSVHFLPKLIISNELVNSFMYLCQYFSFSMQNFEHKTILLDTITDLLTEIDNTPCHQKNKPLLCHRLVLCNIYWHFTIADIS